LSELKESTRDLRGVSETLLIPLAARILESRRDRGAFVDSMAVSIGDLIGFDPQETGKDTLNMAGVVARTVILDRLVREFLARYPSGTVVNLGAGLCTRYFRVAKAESLDVRWVEIDLPEVISLKRELVPREGGFHLISGSVTDSAWMEETSLASDGPVLFVAEGLFMYLPEPKVRQVLIRLADRFPGSELLLEGWARFVVGVWARLSPSIRKTGAQLAWGLDSPETLAGWDPRIQVLGSWRPGEWDPARWGLLRHIGWLRRQLMLIVHLRLGESVPAGEQ
jgi:O-methyltransferase involved in polyketide biosynthesis